VVFLLNLGLGTSKVPFPELETKGGRLRYTSYFQKGPAGGGVARVVNGGRLCGSVAGVKGRTGGGKGNPVREGRLSPLGGHYQIRVSGLVCCGPEKTYEPKIRAVSWKEQDQKTNTDEKWTENMGLTPLLKGKGVLFTKGTDRMVETVRGESTQIGVKKETGDIVNMQLLRQKRKAMLGCDHSTIKRNVDTGKGRMNFSMRGGGGA